MVKKRIAAGGLIGILFAAFISLGYAKEISVNKVSPVQINALSVEAGPELTRLSLSIGVNNPAGPESAVEIKKSAEKLVEYFFVGLALDEERFWVNLSPEEPAKISDSLLAGTELGKVMLYADLQIKKDVSRLLNHRTVTGKEFWSRLYKKAQELGVDEVPFVNRVWIVPDEVRGYEEKNQFFLLENKLKVCLEPAYLAQGVEQINAGKKELQVFACGLMEELILPSLNEKVNSGGSYADLRQAYAAVALARWYKERFGFSDNSFHEAVDEAGTGSLDCVGRIRRDYLDSFKKTGYLSLNEMNNAGDTPYSAMSTLQYSTGGIDFRKIEFTKLGTMVAQQGSSYILRFVIRSLEKTLQYAKNSLELIPQDKLQPAVEVASLIEDLPPIDRMEAQERPEIKAMSLRTQVRLFLNNL